MFTCPDEGNRKAPGLLHQNRVWPVTHGVSKKLQRQFRRKVWKVGVNGYDFEVIICGAGCGKRVLGG